MIDLLIHWNVDPEAFSIGPLTLRWYGLLWFSGFVACYYAFRELLKFNKLPENYEFDALWYMMLGTIIGARLGDCFFYHPMDYLQNPLEIFAVWRGGLSSHGGACGILVSLYLLSRKTQKPYIWTLDRVVIVIGVMGFCIRMGNLMNSEIYGHATNLPWGFIFERYRETVPKHPTQIYEALWYALTYIVLRFVYRKNGNNPKPFLMFGLFLIMVFTFRFCVEFIKNPQESFEENMIFNMGQLLSTPFIIMGIISLIISRRQEKTEKKEIISEDTSRTVAHPSPNKNI
jgi:prolipoprotein diacylglyceryl transferase